MKITGNIVVRAIDPITKKEIDKPISNTIVVFTNTKGVVINSTVTNDKGLFTVDLPNEEYSVQAYVVGSQQDIVTFRQGDKFKVDATTVAGTSFNLWLNNKGDISKDPLVDYLEQLSKETAENARLAKQHLDTMKNNSIGRAKGKWIKEGGHGLGDYNNSNDTAILSSFSQGLSGKGDISSSSSPFKRAGYILRLGAFASAQFQMHFGIDGLVKFRKGAESTGWENSAEFWTTTNTIVDTNGNIKRASPTVELFNDHITFTGFGDQVPIFEKIAMGTYKISNTHGLAREGWTYEKPRGKDGNTYFKIKVQKLDDGCIISVHDYFVDYEDVTIIDDAGNKRTVKKQIEVLSQARDIKPEERWIDLRFFEKIYSIVDKFTMEAPYRPENVKPYIKFYISDEYLKEYDLLVKSFLLMYITDILIR